MTQFLDSTKMISLNVIQEISDAINPKQFQLILLPTEKCNFRCTYCYEDFEYGRMSSKVILGVKQLIERRMPDLDRLIISWFGGEPLLARDIVLDISQFASNLRNMYPNVTYLGDMTTNGYFLDINTFQELVQVGVQSFQISLDGEEDLHNKSRLKADGKGTFSQIWSNLIAIRDSGIQGHIVLRLHFTVENWKQMIPLIHHINDYFANDHRFSVFLKKIERLGSLNDNFITLWENGTEFTAMQILKSELHSSLLNPISEDKTSICYASKANSFVVRSTGALAKCTVALRDPKNNVGTLKEDGTVEIHNAHFKHWLRGLQSGNLDTLRCPLD